VRYFARTAFAGRHTRAVDALHAATASLSLARKDLTTYAREHLRIGEADLWSVADSRF
jgi:hypothetical protein